jgi:hypothetical protein
MKYDGDYIDAGADYYDRRDQRNREHLVRHHQQALARLPGPAHPARRRLAAASYDAAPSRRLSRSARHRHIWPWESVNRPSQAISSLPALAGGHSTAPT